MVKLHLQPKLETKLATHGNFTKIHRKYKMERELQKIELKNRFKDVKLGESPLFIDTMDKLWLLDENNSNDQDCTTWQALIGWNTSSVDATSAFRFNKMLPY